MQDAPFSSLLQLIVLWLGRCSDKATGYGWVFMVAQQRGAMPYIPAAEIDRAIAVKLALDPALADECRWALSANPLRAVLPAGNIDLVRLLSHARASANRARTRDFVLLGVVLLSFIYTGASLSGEIDIAYILGFIVLIADRFAVNRICRRELAGQPSDGLFKNVADQSPERLQYLARARDANLVVYSGFDPLAAFGVRVGGWSLPIAGTSKDATTGDADHVDVDVVAVLDRVEKAVLATGPRGLQSKNVAFVNGVRMSRDPRVVPHPLAPPLGEATPSLVGELFRNPLEGSCAYKLFTVSTWGGQLVTNVLFRLRYVGSDLYAEAEYRVLTPVAALEEARQRVSPDPWRVAVAWFETFVSVPFIVASAPVRVLRRVFETIDVQSARSRERFEAERNPYYDRGGSVSVRQVVGESSDGGGARYRVYLEYLDREMYLKIIERQVVEELASALDAFGIDTEAFRGRSSVIYNSGVMLSGATIKGENVAIGNQASITTQIKDAVGAATRRLTNG